MTDIETIYDLDDALCENIFSAKVGNKTIEVKQYEQLRWLTIGGIAIQSIIDVTDPAKILNPVTQIMLSSCYLLQDIDKVLNLGMGGGSVERFFASALPETSLSSVESEKTIIYVAHEFFFIPGTALVDCIDAEEFIADDSEKYDLILCDMFIDEFHPEFLYKSSFYKDVQNSLTNKGILAINSTPEDQNDLFELLLELRKYFQYTYLYEIEDHYNIIIFASNEAFDLEKPLPTHRESLNYSKQLLDMDVFFSALKQLPSPNKL